MWTQVTKWSFYIYKKKMLRTTFVKKSQFLSRKNIYKTNVVIFVNFCPENKKCTCLSTTTSEKKVNFSIEHILKTNKKRSIFVKETSWKQNFYFFFFYLGKKNNKKCGLFSPESKNANVCKKQTNKKNFS